MAGPTERFRRVSVYPDLGGRRCCGLAAAPGTALLLSGCQASLGTGTVVPAVLLDAAAVGALHVSLSWLLVKGGGTCSYRCGKVGLPGLLLRHVLLRVQLAWPGLFLRVQLA